MKNVLIFTDTPQVGGAELQMFLLAKFLDRKKFNPIIACGKSPKLDQWCENFTKEGIEVVRLNFLHKHNPSQYFELKKLIKKRKIDLLHVNVWNPASGRYALALSKKIPTITTEHDPFALGWPKSAIKKSQLKNVRKIVTVSENNKKLLREIHPEEKKKVAIIHNGIDITWWQSQNLRFTDDDKTDLRREIFQTKGADETCILSIAELHERKGLRFLIEAFANLHAKNPKIKLGIVGEGPERSNLEAQIKELKMEDHIKLNGRKKEIPQILKAADIFVLPSRREAFGLVILEAMISKLPVIASRTGGIPEIIESGKNGFLTEPEDSASLEKFMKNLITSLEKRATIGAAGFKTVTEKFSATKMAQEYAKIYATILK